MASTDSCPLYAGFHLGGGGGLGSWLLLPPLDLRVKMLNGNGVEIGSFTHSYITIFSFVLYTLGETDPPFCIRTLVLNTCMYVISHIFQ